jgi:hypothetical protein
MFGGSVHLQLGLRRCGTGANRSRSKLTPRQIHRVHFRQRCPA